MNPLLLADRSPSLRLRALSELGDLPAHHREARRLRAEIAGSAEVRRTLAARPHDPEGIGYLLCRLAYLRYDGPEVATAAERLLALQLGDGSWPVALAAAPVEEKRRTPRLRPLAEGSTMMPIATSLPLRGLAAAGYATDRRVERAYQWLLARRLDDGAWPGDVKADLDVGGMLGGRTPGYRALPRSSGCRSATTGALACLVLHPEHRRSPAVRAGLEHLLSRETRRGGALGWEVARLLGLERAAGHLTFYATFDLAFLLDLAARAGVPAADLDELVAVIEGQRGPFGLWEHPVHPQLSRWLTLDLETSLRRLGDGAPLAPSRSRERRR